jgi:2-polyprenyl-3-methyl-5-hydroxy-6-metoxy-1,4-benzoquinol methylase
MQRLELKDRIAAHTGWRYEFCFEDGIKTPTPNRGVVNRQAQRYHYFFERLLSLTGGSLLGKRALDLGCNSGFWSLQALEAGADFVLGIDGQQGFVDQANLVFEAKGIDSDRYRFECGDVFGRELADEFDVVLCLGLMDHVASPVELFQLIADIDPELVIIDTEVSRARSSVFELTKVYDAGESLGQPSVLIPSRMALEELAAQFGFDAVALALNVADYAGMSDYRRRRRLAFICSRTISLSSLPVQPDPSGVPWWIRDPRALLAG